MSFLADAVAFLMGAMFFVMIVALAGLVVIWVSFGLIALIKGPPPLSKSDADGTAWLGDEFWKIFNLAGIAEKHWSIDGIKFSVDRSTLLTKMTTTDKAFRQVTFPIIFDATMNLMYVDNITKIPYWVRVWSRRSPSYASFTEPTVEMWPVMNRGQMMDILEWMDPDLIQTIDKTYLVYMDESRGVDDIISRSHGIAA